MKVTCLQADLNAGLGIVCRAAASRATLPITQNVLLVAEQDHLKLVATNLEIAITHRVSAMVTEPGSITVPAKLFAEMVSALPAEMVSLDFPQGGTGQISIQCARHRAKLNVMPADDFPPVPDTSGGLVAKVGPKDLRRAIEQVVFAVAVSDTRPILTGANVQIDGDIMTLAGADGFRLAVSTICLPLPVDKYPSVTIPGKTLSEMVRLLSTQAEPVEISVGATGNYLLFKCKNTELVSALLQGTYPNYRSFIPQGGATKALLPTANLLRAVKAASVLAREGTGAVRMMVTAATSIVPGKLTLIGAGDQAGEEVVEVDATVTGPDAKIALAGEYLATLFGVMPGEQVSLEINGPNSPMLFKPVGSSGYLHVIMPLFVQW